MYGGFRIINTEKLDDLKIIADYTEHDSIAYGADWSHLKSEDILIKQLPVENDGNVMVVATCSFYDHLLNISAVPIVT